MSHRTQITLTDAQYRQLKERSARTGLGIAELVRRALATTYGPHRADSAPRVLERTAGAWKDRRGDGASYVEALRPGLGKRLRG